jgi:hypothetical protein
MPRQRHRRHGKGGHLITLPHGVIDWLRSPRARFAHFSVVPISLNTVLKFVPTT